MKIIKTKLCRKIVLPVVYLFALQPSFAQVSSGGLNKTSASKVQLPLNKIQQKAPSPPPTNAGLFKEQSPSFKQPSILKYQGAYQDGSSLKKTFTVMKLVSVKSLNNEKGSIEGIKPRILNEKTESENVNGKVQYCTSKTQTLSADNLQEFSTTFGQNNLIANIYPGALYHFEDYYNGKWAPVPFARNAMALTTSVKNLTGKSYENVSNPSRGTLTNAVAKLFSRHSDNEGEVGYEGFTYNMYKVESAAELDFALNTGGHYLMASASNQFASQERSYHKYLVIDGYKKMFNISASPGIESSGSANLKYTNPNNTTQGDGLLQDASKLTNDMVYINNVTYGARVIAIVQLDSYSKQTSDKISAALEFGFAGGSADMMSKLQSFNTTMSITYYCVGGNSGQAKYARNFDEMEHDIRSLFEGLNYKNAQPVSYTLANINNENIKARSATDEYTSRSCFSDDDKKIEAFIDKMEKLDGNETDLEIYGQVWARVFDGAGKGIFPGSVSDRLFDLIRDQHLNAGSFISNAGWKPNKVVQFTIPNNGFRGSKIVIYYWFMDQDKGGEANDDLQSRRGGNGEKRNDKRGYIFDAREFNLDQGYEDNDRHTFKKYDEFTDKDGESGIKFSAIVKISDLPASKK